MTDLESRRTPLDERGAAVLVVVLVLALAVSALAIGSSMVATNSSLVHRFNDRQSVMETVAEAGLAEARSRLNGTRALYPDSGYVQLEDEVTVTDASGEVIEAVRRSTWAGPSGITTGQYGVNGSIVTLVEDDYGNALIRRHEIREESFSRYAVFTDRWPGNLGYARGEEMFGPVHHNDGFRIWNCCGNEPPATFHGPTSTAGLINGKQYGDFKQGYVERSPYIAMPTTADLARLRTLAQVGGMAFTAANGGLYDQAMMRMEFIPVDLDGDLREDGEDEGFVRIYQAKSTGDLEYLMAELPLLGMGSSANCGDVKDGEFLPLVDHPGSHNHNAQAAATTNGARCYLGGSDELNADVSNPDGRFVADDGRGDWMRYTGTVDPRVRAARPDDADYLFPITRGLNPDFKGVIHVTGKVAISGRLRGRVTVAATGNLIIADDIRYVTDPGAPDRSCRDDDMLGVFSGANILIAYNTINAPQRPPLGGPWRTYDETKDEYIHGTLLALLTREVADYRLGSTNGEACEGTTWGRGCLYLTGGMITKTAGATGVLNGTGNLERNSYDQCAADYPPPYFPTTGHFSTGQYFEVDPNDFDIDTYFAQLAGG